MGKNYLLLTYYNNYGANSTCARNIANELLAQGHNVVVLSVLEDGYQKHSKEGCVEVYRITPSLFEAIQRKRAIKDSFLLKVLSKVLSILRLFFAVPFYPNVAPIQTLRVSHKADLLIQQYNVDVVLGMYRPYEMIGAAMKIKKKYGDKVKVLTYHLDLLSSPSNTNAGVIDYKIRKADKAFKKECSICDKILLPNSVKEVFKNNKDKVAFLDFPLFIETDYSGFEAYSFSQDTINIVYAGSLDCNNRNIEPFISLIDRLPSISNREVQLHIWGILYDEKTINAVNSSKKVIFHGKASSNEIPGILQGADYLLNVSNKITYEMIPSKIFQLFSANKPIINYVQNEDDRSLPYFNRLDCVLNVHNYLDVDHTQELEGFLSHYLDVVVSIDRDLFVESTPRYAVSLLEMT